MKTIEGHTDMISSLDINKDDTKLVTGDRDAKVILWDIETGKELFCKKEH